MLLEQQGKMSRPSSVYSHLDLCLCSHPPSAPRAGPLLAVGPLFSLQRAVTSPLLTAPLPMHQEGTVPWAAAGSAAGVNVPTALGPRLWLLYQLNLSLS